MNRSRTMVAVLAVVLISAAMAAAIILTFGTGSNASIGPEGNPPAEVPKVRNHVVNVTDSMEVEDKR